MFDSKLCENSMANTTKSPVIADGAFAICHAEPVSASIILSKKVNPETRSG